MAKQNINVGTAANDKKGDSLRAAFVKVNNNFTELYAALGLTDVTLNLGAFTFTGSTMSTDDSTNIVIDKPITVNGEIVVDGDITPKTNFGASLGTPTRQFKSLYVSTNTVFLGGVPLSLEAGTNELTINNVPISQTINYADIPNAPKDLSDLTDNSGSLGGGVTSYNDLTNKPTLFSGSYNDLTNKPNLAGTYQFSVAADDSTQRVISTDEVIKFIGAGGITTASDAEGNITITGSGGSVSSLVNGAKTVSLDSTGSLTLPGDIRSDSNINIEINLADSTKRIWQFGEDGDTVFPNNVAIRSNGAGYRGIYGDDGISLSLVGSGEGSANIIWNDNATSPTQQAVFSGNNYGIGRKAKATITAQGNSNPARTWKFDEDGALTLPAGGTITEGGGISGAIKLKPAGGANANQALLIYPTAGAPEGDHIHLTAGGGATELYLGDDYHYVKLVDGGNIQVQAFQPTSPYASSAWTFGTDGSLASDDEFTIKAPNGVPTGVYAYSGGGGWNSPPYTNLATTTNGSGTGLTVNVSTAVGGYININYITIATAGTGYKTGDIITITNENNLTGTFGVVVAGTNSWTFDINGGLTLPSGNSSIQSVQNGNYQSKVTVSPFQILSQARTSQAQSYTIANGDFTTATSDGNGMITFVSPSGWVTEFLIDTMENGGVYDRTVRLNGAGPEYGYAYFDGTNQVILAIAAPAGAVTSIRFSYTRISKIDISPDNGVFNIQSESGQDIDIQSGRHLDIVATSHAWMTSGTNMRLQAGDGTVRISTNYNAPNATQRDWNFDNDGQLTLPNGAVLRNTDNGAVAFGQGAGQNTQSATAIAIGNDAGYYTQGADAVAIGRSAGEGYQGANAIAIGLFAGQNNQAANSIVLNATGVALEQTTANTFTVAPIRNISATSGVLQYNASTKEVSYSLNVTAETFNTDQITVVGNRISTTVTNANLELECNGTGAITINNNTTIASSSLTFSGNISAAAWTTSGIRHISSPATLTDTSSTGTVANAYTNNFGGNTIAASNATTYTNYATVFLNDPTAGTNVTFTNAYSLITAGNVKFGSTGTGTITAVAATATTNSTAASVGYQGLPQSGTATTATLAIGDAGKHIYITSTGQTITIPAAASVAYPIGTTITFIAGPSATTVSIAITTDTMRLAGGALTGTRTLAANGMATAVKVASTTWYINGTGLT